MPHPHAELPLPSGARPASPVEIAPAGIGRSAEREPLPKPCQSPHLQQPRRTRLPNWRSRRPPDDVRFLIPVLGSCARPGVASPLVVGVGWPLTEVGLRDRPCQHGPRHTKGFVDVLLPDVMVVIWVTEPDGVDRQWRGILQLLGKVCDLLLEPAQENPDVVNEWWLHPAGKQESLGEVALGLLQVPDGSEWHPFRRRHTPSCRWPTPRSE